MDDWMDFPRMEFPDVDRKLYGRHAANVMKTDVHEHDNEYRWSRREYALVSLVQVTELKCLARKSI